MSWFARIEETCAAYIERAFARVFPSDLEPAQIARKLVATMEARTQAEEASMKAPARYAVFVHPADFRRLEPHRAYLQAEWALLLDDVAQRVGIEFAGASKSEVQLRAEPSIVAGAVEIDASDVMPEPARKSAKTFGLRMVKGVPPGSFYALSGAMRVGRSPESDIVLADPSVSRNHALLDVLADTLIVRDAGSTNGTFVNGERVGRRVLHAGDLLAFGKTEMRVEAAQP